MICELVLIWENIHKRKQYHCKIVPGINRILDDFTNDLAEINAWMNFIQPIDTSSIVRYNYSNNITFYDDWNQSIPRIGSFPLDAWYYDGHTLDASTDHNFQFAVVLKSGVKAIQNTFAERLEQMFPSSRIRPKFYPIPDSDESD